MSLRQWIPKPFYRQTTTNISAAIRLSRPWGKDVIQEFQKCFRIFGVFAVQLMTNITAQAKCRSFERDVL